MHPYPGNWVAIGHAVVHYAWINLTFSAVIECRHFIIILLKIKPKGDGNKTISLVTIYMSYFVFSVSVIGIGTF